jgi:colanic acid/amylovoran biosynthesis glycosyltransferase
MRIAYFTNRYPAPYHTYIRREIQAMEALGVSTFRYALRSGAGSSLDQEDEIEERLTRYLLNLGIASIARCCVSTILLQPIESINAFYDTIKIGFRSDRGIIRHIVYLIEAVVLASWCRRDNIEHVHAHFGTNPAAIAMLAKRFTGIPYSFTLHGADEFEKAELLSLDVKLKNAAFAVCVCSFGRSQLMRRSHPEQWSKIKVIHCGVDHLFLDHPLRSPSDTPRFVCVGRFDTWKGQIVLIGAARRLRDAGIRCEIILVGDGPFREFIEDAIRGADLEGTVRIVGLVSGLRVKEEILAARCLVLPSFYEGLPVVIMEAMALGRPVISTYVGGIPELVESGKTGRLVPAGDEIALSEAMRGVLETSAEQLAAMGAEGRLRAIERHDSVKEAAKLKRLFEMRQEAERDPCLSGLLTGSNKLVLSDDMIVD